MGNRAGIWEFRQRRMPKEKYVIHNGGENLWTEQDFYPFNQDNTQAIANDHWKEYGYVYAYLHYQAREAVTQITKWLNQ